MTRPIVVVGAGSVGQRHARNLRSLGHEKVILLRTGRGTLPVDLDLPTISTLDQAVDLNAEAVVIANPTALHVPTALAAARAGLHLFIEKPLSHTLVGVAELQETVVRKGLVALVGYHLRYHPTLRLVRAWIDEGRLGKVVSAIARWGEYLPGWHPWEDHRTSYAATPSLGGGVIHTLSHPLDYLAWLLGPIASVQAMADTRGDLGVECEDVAHVTLRTESGAIATILLDYARHPQVHRLEIVGSLGVVEWDMLSSIATFTGHDSRVRIEEPTAEPPFERNTIFREEMAHFLGCLRGSEIPRCTLKDGELALRAALAAHRSVGQGRVVHVSSEESPSSGRRRPPSYLAEPGGDRSVLSFGVGFQAPLDQAGASRPIDG